MEIKLDNNRKLVYTVISNRDIVINSSNYLVTESHSATGTIESIKFDNSYTIALGDKLPYKVENKDTGINFNIQYKVNKISKKKAIYTLTEEDELKSNYFLIPSIVTGDIDRYNIPNLMNCYVDTNHKDWAGTPGVLYLKYRFKPFESFIQMDKYFEEKNNYVNKLVLDGYRVYIFKILSEYLKDVNCYSNNQYYSISLKYSQLIIDYFKLPKDSLIYRLFFDRPNLKKEMEEYWGWDNKYAEIPLFDKPLKPILEV